MRIEAVYLLIFATLAAKSLLPESVPMIYAALRMLSR